MKRLISDSQLRKMQHRVTVDGISYRTASAEFGISRSTVKRYMQVDLSEATPPPVAPTPPPSRKLSDEQIIEAKAKVAAGEPKTALAKLYKIGKSTLARYLALDLGEDKIADAAPEAATNEVFVNITLSSVVLAIDGEVYTIESTNKLYTEIVDLANSREIYTIPKDEILDKISVSRAISRYVSGDIVAEHGILKFKGKVIDTTLARYILHNMEQGLPVDNIVNFMNNLYENTSYRAVNEVFDFIKACNLPISDDGYLIAYKKVRNNYTDCHSGTFDNSIGQKPNMPRYEVNEDKHQTCSTGLHFCSASYLDSFGTFRNKSGSDRIMIVKVNPKDIVSVPKDYNNAKARACEYEVIGEVRDPSELKPFHYKGA